ncbi:MAG TPA: hypothetical protein VGM66_09010, partial [Candidatus Udaeobacter sp.]
VLSRNSYTPLTSQQIADLFRAGQIGRDEPCRLLESSRWRTLDELFPLLKYESRPSQFFEKRRRELTPLPFIVASAVAFALAGLAYLIWPQGVPIKRHAEARELGNAPSHLLPVVARFTAIPSFVSTPPSLNTYQDPANTQSFFAAKRQREQAERERAAREQAAVAAQRQAAAEQQRQAAQKSAWRDYHVPLDEDYMISVGGSPVRVKVHDNDVTSFDVWINGAWYREIPKQKGITHSGTDETLIYGNGGASLYYVWEISGELNQCLLRVREN